MSEYKLLVFIHLLAGSIWVGGHLVLSLALLPRAWKSKEVAALLHFEKSYEAIGLPALFFQVLTGIRLSFLRLPDPVKWLQLDQPLSKLIFLKLFLLVATLLFAFHAKWRVLPSLHEKNLPLLAFHIFSVTVLGIFFVLVGVTIRLG